MKKFMKASGARCSVLLLLALLVTCAPAWAADVVYDVTWNGSGTDDTITCEKDGAPDATTSLKDLVNNKLNTGDNFTVNVGAGTYVLVGGSLELPTNVKLIGAEKATTILKGDGTNPVITCTDGAGVEISNLTVDGKGQGGIKLTAGDLKVTNCDFTGVATAIAIADGSPVVEDCTFTGSTAVAMTIAGSGTPKVTKCAFTDIDKGAMSIGSSAKTTVTSCDFTGKSGATEVAMKITAGTPEVNACKFTGNTKGAINVATGATPTVKNCIFSNNSGVADGAAMYITGGVSTVDSCSFVGNKATTNGGALYIAADKSTVTNCTFSQNKAADGAGMYVAGTAAPAVVNCTFSVNDATGNGGGMYVVGGATSKVVNTILWGNTATTGKAAYYAATSGSVELKNCVFNADEVKTADPGCTVADTNCFKTDPKLSYVAGPMPHYNLLADSSAIGKGATSVTAGVTVPTMDQLGKTRNTTAPDIGAVEHYDTSAPSTGPTTTSEDQSGATVTLSPTSAAGVLSDDQLLVNIPAGGTADVTFNLKDWKDKNGNPVTPYEVRAFVGGVERPMTLLTAETYVLKLTPDDVGKEVVLKGHIAGDQWISSKPLTVKQSDAATTKPDPTPSDPAGPSDPSTPTGPTGPTGPSEPITPSDPAPEGGKSSSGGGCQAASFGLLALAAVALLKRK